MSSSAVYGNPQFIIASLPKSRRRSLIRVHFGGFRRWESSVFCFSTSFSCQKPSSRLKFLAKAAASASSFPPVSGAGYSDTYFEAPERVAALILVAPAIVAPFFKRNVRKYDQAGIDNHMKGNNSNSTTPVTLFLILLNIFVKFTKYIADTIVSIVKWMGVMVNSLYKKALSAILRSSVSVMLMRIIIDKFGIPAIRASWCDPNQVSDNVLRGYTKPLKIKGWDKALVEYTVAVLTDKASDLKPPLKERLKYISCPVLIITGDTDRLVPAWNAERLSRAIPGSCLEIIKNCGHLPQEEKAEEFVSIVDKFLQRVFGAAQAPPLQVVT